MSEIKWATAEDLKVGTQVLYVPSHAKNDLDHPDVEEGFVTKVDGGHAFVRYFAKEDGQRLRTTTCSESTPICALVVMVHRPHVQVKRFLDQLGYKL